MTPFTKSLPPPTPESLDEARAEFLRTHPSYAETRALDELRASEYGRLDREGHAYLDYTGAGQYAHRQLRQHLRLLGDAVLGNPHSDSASADEAARWVERTRSRVLQFFRAPPHEYVVVFTPNATGALKHVAESYPFAPGRRLLLLTDNHNSVNGIREFARARGSAITYALISAPEMRADEGHLSLELGRGGPEGPGLFAYPAQSNFTGVQHPLEWIEEAHAAGWDVLLDAAAFTPTNRLDLGRWKPDFVAVSFYKMFGYPTGVGCLVLRRAMLAKLKRPWFAGGTVRIASVQADAFERAPDAAGFEDGTVNYLSLPAVEAGLAHMEDVGIERIHERVRCLTGWILERMAGLRHRNGGPLIRVHGPATLDRRGGTVAFNLLDPTGACFDIQRLEELAGKARISLRTGCFCNPGAGETAFGLTRLQVEGFFGRERGLGFDEMRAALRRDHDKDVGAVRASLGIASNFEDVYRLDRFLRDFLNRCAREIGTAAAPGRSDGTPEPPRR